jgi:hypothetical protein
VLINPKKDGDFMIRKPAILFIILFIRLQIYCIFLINKIKTKKKTEIFFQINCRGSHVIRISFNFQLPAFGFTGNNPDFCGRNQNSASMKRFFPCGLFVATLISGVVMTGVHGWQKDLTVRNSPPASSTHDGPATGQDVFLTVPDMPSVPAPGWNTSSHSRLPVITVKAENHPYSLLKICFSKRISRRLSATRAVYTALSSQKEKEGYYLYALRKLRI